ncbi:hypothetical protein KUCAC02_023687 [Chaenocephalus aceratus]|uniref:Uncharacterized protein n=1 Tax=Chaenocephalus aceratus TaxID=36190 RepID=A0ACB9WFN2_CHAAC|nr:hypothetical protein KUCAC02_023687 [Chaenocephalus aceratus]
MCRQEAFRIFNGLCPPCMQRQQPPEMGEPQQNNPRTEASSSAWTQARDTERPGPTLAPGGHASAWQAPLARPCKRSGCQFFGTQEKLGFCTICYVDYQTNHHLTPPPAPVQNRHGVEAGFQNASRCRGPGCGAVGKAMLEGYCDNCYVKEQSTRLNQVAHRTPHSPPLVLLLIEPFSSFSLFTFTFSSATRAVKPRSSQQSQTQNPTQTQTQNPDSDSDSVAAAVACSQVVSPGCTEPLPGVPHPRTGPRGGQEGAGAKEKSKQRCRTQGCDHYANQEKQGYCNECDHFKQIYRG